MRIRNILLTGDDGYNSIGTRTLIHYLKNRYVLSVAGTQTQQSGVGGLIHVAKGVHWKEVEVDGVKGISVQGSPGDAVEVADAYFKKKFDLVISGINLGANIGGSFFTSGTIAAVLRSLLLNLSKYGITMSYHTLDFQHWYHDHDGTDDISSYLEYPGKVAFKLIEYCIDQSLWGCSFVNVNFPTKKSSKVRFTRPLNDLGKFYTYPGTLDKKNGVYRFPMKVRESKSEIQFDAGSIQRNYISITPCKADLLDKDAYDKLKEKEITL